VHQRIGSRQDTVRHHGQKRRGRKQQPRWEWRPKQATSQAQAAIPQQQTAVQPNKGSSDTSSNADGPLQPDTIAPEKEEEDSSLQPEIVGSPEQDKHGQPFAGHVDSIEPAPVQHEQQAVQASASEQGSPTRPTSPHGVVCERVDEERTPRPTTSLEPAKIDAIEEEVRPSPVAQVTQDEQAGNQAQSPLAAPPLPDEEQGTPAPHQVQAPPRRQATPTRHIAG
jgi:hypothetical protein